MEALSGIIHGFSIALDPQILFFCFLGCFLGTLIGVLPGIGPGGALAILLPVTFGIPPATAIIMLAGIYYGAMYGGSTTSILINIPGEAASVITCIDGYQMARNGRAGPALGISAIGSFIAGTICVLGLMLVAPPLARFALKFTSVEYVSIILFGLTLLSFLGSGTMVKSLMMAAVGLLIATVGTDPVEGVQRYTFDSIYMLEGVGLVPVAMGLFGISEILLNLEEKEIPSILREKVDHLYPTMKDWRDSRAPILRGTVIGFFIGLLPGGNAIISSIIDYAVEKRLSKRPETFGNGAIEGVAGPESANNASSTASFVPLLSLGIPTNAVMALLLASLMIHNVLPGPMLIKQHPDVFWSVIASMYIGNIMLLVLNLPLVGIWARLLAVPYYYLFPFILLFCAIGSYTLSNTLFDISVMLFFGVIGFLLRKFEYDPTPLILAFVLGPMLEDNFRRSLTISGGSFLVFIKRPISAIFLIAAFFLLVSSITPVFKKARDLSRV
jgi:putative tricarboxylic transport membrane protein